MKKSASSHILNGLNGRQKDAVEHIHGPLLILAGAGSGKTKVLAHRIANIVRLGCSPERVLAITFTNKAAGEMQKRISALISNNPLTASRPFVRTFHALGVHILRESGHHIGISKKFSIFDEEDALSLMKDCLRDLSIDPKQFQPAKMRSVISAHKSELLTPEDLAEDAHNSPFLVKLIAVWQLYEKKLKEHSALDFDDLIAKTIALLKKSSETLKRYQAQWTHIHIDEYQDTNRSQYLLASLLAREHRNLCAVGDIDQSIYGWRGADFRNILNFEKDWPEAKIITLEENYRSTQTILDAANAVIIKNQFRRPKNLFTEKTGGNKIKIFLAANELEEAAFIAQTARACAQNNTPADKIAVLYRTNFQSRVLEEEFLRQGMPYQLLGVKFYERKEVKDILAYIRIALNPQDLLSKKRIINTPARGIGKILLTKYLARDKDLNPKEKTLLQNFEEIIQSIGDAAATKPASEVTRAAIEKSGYANFLRDGTEEGAMRLANIQELVSLSKKYDIFPSPAGIEELLADAALMSDQDTLKEREKAVKLMTVHAAKGLEFKTVFVAGMEEGLFPHNMMGGGSDPLKAEEERRLFYVALTRAEENLFLSYAIFRTIFGSRQINKPSRFLEDIPPELTEAVNRENMQNEYPESDTEIINL
ncbi:MAG: UvrD-helicase domain-containing protein [Candidatus Niyogibacteria bacterium]|nr:UvrD-helicase domain-containing protein [Candidatus Niyogibacteria bacterium]